MEEKKRTLEDVTQEHNQLCFRAGMLQYRMRIEQAELDQIFHKVVELNQEASKLNEIEQKAKELATETKEVAHG